MSLHGDEEDAIAHGQSSGLREKPGMVRLARRTPEVVVEQLWKVSAAAVGGRRAGSSARFVAFREWQCKVGRRGYGVEVLR